MESERRGLAQQFAHVGVVAIERGTTHGREVTLLSALNGARKNFPPAAGIYRISPIGPALR
jgi:hypothetical protein